MDTNAVADEVKGYLDTKHTRVYRNRSPQNSTFPYIVYRVEGILNSYPSEDLYVNIDVYEDTNKSVRDIEDLADSIDKGLNITVINTADLNLQFNREQRQYVSATELVSSHMINLRYTVRAYFK